MLNEFKRPMWNDGYSKEQPWLNYFNSYERMHCCFGDPGDEGMDSDATSEDTDFVSADDLSAAENFEGGSGGESDEEEVGKDIVPDVVTPETPELSAMEKYYKNLKEEEEAAAVELDTSFEKNLAIFNAANLSKSKEEIEDPIGYNYAIPEQPLENVDIFGSMPIDVPFNLASMPPTYEDKSPALQKYYSKIGPDENKDAFSKSADFRSKLANETPTYKEPEPQLGEPYNYSAKTLAGVYGIPYSQALEMLKGSGGIATAMGGGGLRSLMEYK
tara:strand:- start:284 stop:1102 length:819 start_codon:yes stop_codon:yes gene_type:complete